MKKIIILAVALLAVAGSAVAQKAAKQIVTTVFVTDIDCENCAKKIYDNFYGKGVKSIKCDVATICVGMAASMGAFLLSAGTKGKRMALPNAEIMIHQPSAGTQGQITDMAIHLKRLETIKARMNKILAENTGRSIEEVTAACERDNFMSADEALAFGIIDRVLEHH